jgi:hypothetical protein
MEYLVNTIESISIKKGGTSSNFLLKIDTIAQAISETHKTIDKLSEFEVDIFALLGMRNLSAFIGEIFVVSLQMKSNSILVKNPHQDGYPDLLLADEKGRGMLDQLSKNMQDKRPFSNFANGGIEVKATCGSVPTPSACKKKGLLRPDIGETRCSLVTGFDWKAHHRETNNLIGIFWDFIDRKPRIVACFYSNQLTQESWGKIVQPREGGGRTTSVSIMSKQGITEMCDGWLFIQNDEKYKCLIKKKLSAPSSLDNCRKKIHL